MKKDLNYLISLFEKVNPLFEKIYSNKTERSELELFVKKVGFEKAEKILLEMPEIMKKDKFMADLSISRPSELNRKFNTLCNAKTRLIKEKKDKAPRKYPETNYKERTEEQRLANLKRIQDIRASNPSWLLQNDTVKGVKPTGDRKCPCGNLLTYQAKYCSGWCIQKYEK